MRHKITAMGGLSPAAAAAVMAKPVVAPEVNPSQQSITLQRHQQENEQCSTTLDIELLKEFELIGADSKNDDANNEEIKAEVREEKGDSAAVAADDILEPEPRARCNTWPRLQYAAANSVVNGGSPVMQQQRSPLPAQATTLPLVCEEESGSTPMDDQQQPAGGGGGGSVGGGASNGSAGAVTKPEQCEPPVTLGVKKSGARRNPWGNMSYADLITQAITTAPEKRLTLAQIYEWLVKNVPYFHGKGDNISSIGWKNSIRHNLSLHSKFVRVQNEGTGKSSWWMLNPDAAAQATNVAGSCSAGCSGSGSSGSQSSKHGPSKSHLHQHASTGAIGRRRAHTLDTSTSKRKMAAANAAAAARRMKHNSGAAGRSKNSSVSDDLRRAASIGCLSQQQQQTVAVVAAAGVDPASVSPVGAGAIPDIFDGQFRSRTLSHGSRPIATTPFRTRTYSNASSGEGGGGGCHPSPPLTDITLPAQSVLTPPSSNMTMDSPAYSPYSPPWQPQQQQTECSPPNNNNNNNNNSNPSSGLTEEDLENLMKLDLSGIDLDQFNQQPGQQERQQQLAQELQDLCRENMKMEPQQQEQYNPHHHYAQQDQMNLEGHRIGGNMNHQERKCQQSGYGIPYQVKQEVMGTSPIDMGYPSSSSDSSGPQHKMTILELRENQEIMQQQQLTGQQGIQWQQQQISMFHMHQNMMYPMTTTNKLRLSASPSGGGCIPVDTNNATDSFVPHQQQQQQQQSHLSMVSENGDVTIDELFNADNGSGVDIFGTDTLLDKQFDFGIAGGGGNGAVVIGDPDGGGEGNTQMDITDPMETFELF